MSSYFCRFQLGSFVHVTRCNVSPAKVYGAGHPFLYNGNSASPFACLKLADFHIREYNYIIYNVTKHQRRWGTCKELRTKRSSFTPRPERRVSIHPMNHQTLLGRINDARMFLLSSFASTSSFCCCLVRTGPHE